MLPVQIAGLVFGASGTFPYFQACFQAYKFISTLRRYSEDASDFEIRLLIEEYRLLQWGRLHNLVTDKYNQSRSTHQGLSEYLLLPTMQGVVAPLLATAAGKMDEMNKIVERHALRHPVETGSDLISTDHTSTTDHPSDPLRHPFDDPEVKKAAEDRKERVVELKKQSRFINKIGWTLRDRRALDDALKAYAEIVTKLYDLTSPSLLAYLVEGLGSRILPSSSLPVQSRLEKIEPYRRVAGESNYTELKAELDAQVEAWKIEGEEENTSMEILDISKLPTFTLDETRVSWGNSRKRCFGTVNGAFPKPDSRVSSIQLTAVLRPGQWRQWQSPDRVEIIQPRES